MTIYEIMTQLSEEEAKKYIKNRFIRKKGEIVDRNEPKLDEESEGKNE